MAYGTSAGGTILTAQEAQGRNTNSIMAGWVDRGPFPYWDTLQAAAGTALASSYQMFAIPIGQQNPLAGNTVKTKLQTNLTKSGEFPASPLLAARSSGLHFRRPARHFGRGHHVDADVPGRHLRAAVQLVFRVPHR